MMPSQYHLEVYKAGSFAGPVAAFSSRSPFMPIAAGDIIETAGWAGYARHDPSAPLRVLRVVGVRHFLWERDGDPVKPGDDTEVSEPEQKVIVHVEEVAVGDTDELARLLGGRGD
jgi:hypothetical protein